MTDADLVAKKLAFIETCLRELRSMARPERLADDLRERRFVEHTLQITIQAALDVASHIVSDEKLGEPETNRELFELLRKDGWISTEQAIVMQRMIGFRNTLVHGYQRFDPRILQDIVMNRLDDLLAFVAAIRERSEG